MSYCYIIIIIIIIMIMIMIMIIIIIINVIINVNDHHSVLRVYFWLWEHLCYQMSISRRTAKFLGAQ